MRETKAKLMTSLAPSIPRSSCFFLSSLLVHGPSSPARLNLQGKYQKRLPDVSHWEPSSLLLKLAESGEGVGDHYAKTSVMSRL